MEKIIGKKYYRITFRNTSPLSIGSGEKELTDQDILLDNSGIPYIPGSALAGVYRRLFKTTNKEKSKNYFGRLAVEEYSKIDKSNLEESKKKEAKEELKDIESLLMIYDATIINRDDIRIVSRDMVHLDAYKTAVDGAKFDFQVLEPGIQFVTYIEQNLTADRQEDLAGSIASAFYSGALQIGSKTGRGFGAVKADEVYSATFSFEPTNKTGEVPGIDKWLDFSMYENPENRDSCWTKVENIGASFETPVNEKRLAIMLELKQAGGISIRRYTTNEKEADYEQLTVRKPKGNGEYEEIPVIPGTSWAGAFRAQMKKLNPDLNQEDFFGKVKESKRKKEESDGKENTVQYKSHMFFGESQIQGAHSLVYIRNAIDRFSGAAANGALYTEKTWFGGRTTLEIVYDNLQKYSEDEADADQARTQNNFLYTLAAAITDLKEGYMAIGGLTAVGRGLFTCNKITVQCGSQPVMEVCLEDGKILTEGATPQESDTTMDPVYQWLTDAFSKLTKAEHNTAVNPDAE